MKLKQLANSTVFLVVMTWPCSVALAGAKGEHVHGQGRMGLAIDGPASEGSPVQVNADLTLPADSLFGFERAPRDEKDWAKVSEMTSKVKSSAAAWLSFDASLACRSVAADVQLPGRFIQGESKNSETSKDAKHTGDVPHEHKKDHHAKDSHHGKESHHGDHGGDHADIEVKLSYSCDKTPQGTSVKFGGFESLPKLNKLKVQILGLDLQKSAELTRKNAVISLSKNP